jgi:hypothetical protein
MLKSKTLILNQVQDDITYFRARFRVTIGVLSFLVIPNLFRDLGFGSALFLK